MRRGVLVLGAALLLAGVSGCGGTDGGSGSGSDAGAGQVSSGGAVSSVPVVPAPVDPATPITEAEVARHASAEDCWVSIAGNVYDLTSWAPAHPGGREVIVGLCGGDGSGAFFMQHATQQQVREMLESFRVGTLER